MPEAFGCAPVPTSLTLSGRHRIAAQHLLRDAVKLIDSWIDAHCDQFNPFEWNADEEAFFRRKSFSEAALYLYAVEGLS